MPDDDRLLFGATVDGVRALMPHRLIDVQSKPSEADVITFVEAIADRVITRLGPPAAWPDVDPRSGELGLRAQLVDTARDLVHVGAGARTQDAAFPDEIGRLGDRRYAAELWRQYEAGVAELIGRLEAAGYVVDLEPGATVPPAPVFTMPERPLFTRGMRW